MKIGKTWLTLGEEVRLFVKLDWKFAEGIGDGSEVAGLFMPARMLPFPSGVLGIPKCANKFKSPLGCAAWATRDACLLCA